MKISYVKALAFAVGVLFVVYLILNAQNSDPPAFVTAPVSETAAVDAQQDATESLVKGSASAGNISITDAYVEATVLEKATAAPTMAGMGISSMDMSATTAVYMTLHNNGDQPDKLVTVSADVAGMAVLHQTIIQNNIAQMKDLPSGLDIAAKSSVTLNPGGYHIMLSQLKNDLAPGSTAILTLKFQSGTTVVLTTPVLLP